jgi:hypothetical protein
MIRSLNLASSSLHVSTDFYLALVHRNPYGKDNMTASLEPCAEKVDDMSPCPSLGNSIQVYDRSMLRLSWIPLLSITVLREVVLQKTQPG